jgi:hypothetical protein
MNMSADNYTKTVFEALRSAALAELEGSLFEVSKEDTAIVLRTSCAGGSVFSIRIRGDMFEIIYDEKFVYTDFMVDVENEIREFSTAALREIRLVCNGESQMIPSKTKFRHRPMNLLNTSTGEVWSFYSL